MGSQNHYETLGVDEKAEIEVIKAAHKALAKKYHPDTFDGDKDFATEKLKSINSAYHVLSDPKKRKAYDKTLSSDSETSDFEQHSDFASEFSTPDTLEEDWSILAEVFPEAEDVRRELAKYSAQLAFYFQLQLIVSKSANNALQVGETQKDLFLARFFGSDRHLQNLAEKVLLRGNREIAKEINRKVVLLGVEASERISEEVKQKYSEKLKVRMPAADLTFKQRVSKRASDRKKETQQSSNRPSSESPRKANSAEIHRARQRSKEAFKLLVWPGIFILGLAALVLVTID